MISSALGPQSTQAAPRRAAAAGRPVAILLVMVGTAGYLLRYHNLGLNPLDEGFALVTGLRVLHGQTPYRDFFSQLSPAVFYTQAGLFRLFGVGILPGRLAMVGVGAAMAGLLYLLARRLLPAPLALLAVALWLPWGIPAWFMPSYSWYAALGTLGTLYCMARYQETARSPWLWGCGLLLGLTALYKQNAGLYVAAALTTFLLLRPLLRWARRRSADRGANDGPGLQGAGEPGVRQWLTMVGGVALVVGPALLALGLAGALRDMWRDTVTVVLTVFPREMSVPYGGVWPLWPTSLEAGDLNDCAQRLLYLLPVVYPLTAVLVVGRALTRRATRHDGYLALYALVGGFSWLETFPRADISHLLFFLFLAYALAVYLVWWLASLLPRALSRLAMPIRWVAASLLLAPLLALGVVGATNNESTRRDATYPLDDLSPRAAGIMVNEGQRLGIGGVMSAIHAYSKPGQAIFIMPWSVVFYFLAQRENPTRYDLLIPASLLPEDQPEIIRSLERRKPPLVLYQTSWDVNDKTFAENSPLLDGYVTTHYRQADHVDGADAYSQYDVWTRAAP